MLAVKGGLWQPPAGRGELRNACHPAQNCQSIDGVAGLWEGFKADGTVQRTFTIVTANANAMMAELHNRMPPT